MKDWTVKDLQEWDEKICKIATEKYDLDWFPIEYEILDYKDIGRLVKLLSALQPATI